MKIDKFKEKKNKKKIFLGTTLVILIGVFFIEELVIKGSFASYQENVSFKVMEGTVNYEGSGDVFFTFYKGDTVLDEMPTKDNTDNLAFERGECDKGASISWNRNKWAPMVTNLKESKTKCKLYFGPKVASDTIYDIASNDTATLAYDDTGDSNLRYIGASPNNYIDIGDRDSTNKPILWRIIGVMNNMTVINDDKIENPGQSLIKIIRADSIGSYSWDSSECGVNSCDGVNEWSDSDLMKTLNSDTYWNKNIGQCYTGMNNSNKACDFSSTGLTPEVKDKLVKVRWNTGTTPDDFFTASDYQYNILKNKINVSYMYEGERSNNHGKKFCSGGESNCNDQVTRYTTWDGYIGLMYPSDYGYAVGGSKRVTCLGRSMFEWDDSALGCSGNDWLRLGSNDEWTITPAAYSSYGSYVFRIVQNYRIAITISYDDNDVYPVAYLKSSIKIQNKTDSNYGSYSNPFELES